MVNCSPLLSVAFGVAFPSTNTSVLFVVARTYTRSSEFKKPFITIYSLPITPTGTSWSPIKSRHPPNAAESSLSVTAMGLLDVMRVPTGRWVAVVETANREYVCPRLSVMVNGTPAGCPIKSAVGLMVMLVLSSVATISNPLRAVGE